jgi:hypothetical protein
MIPILLSMAAAYFTSSQGLAVTTLKVPIVITKGGRPTAGNIGINGPLVGWLAEPIFSSIIASAT